ncbi:hypothetical protein TcCL_NonESM12123 [Trypanosoma cruzi]|nr:hypothetical protein TcCL_NonESM12123 [Trypanosoma cruzi]
MTTFTPHWARWWRCRSGAPLSAVRAPVAPWHRPPGDHCCPCISAGLSQHLRGESLQPSHSNWPIIRIYQYRLSLVPEEIITGDLNLHRELWDSHIYHQRLEAIISPLF